MGAGLRGGTKVISCAVEGVTVGLGFHSTGLSSAVSGWGLSDGISNLSDLSEVTDASNLYDAPDESDVSDLSDVSGVFIGVATVVGAESWPPISPAAASAVTNAAIAPRIATIACTAVGRRFQKPPCGSFEFPSPISFLCRRLHANDRAFAAKDSVATNDEDRALA